MAYVILDLNPHTWISLLLIPWVRNPAPVKVMSLPPINEVSTAVKVGFDDHDLVKVVGLTLWYPKLVVWTSTLYFPFGKYPPVGTTE